MLLRDTAVHGRPLTALVLPDVLVSGCRQEHGSHQGRSLRSGGERPALWLTGGGPRAVVPTPSWQPPRGCVCADLLAGLCLLSGHRDLAPLPLLGRPGPPLAERWDSLTLDTMWKNELGRAQGQGRHHAGQGRVTGRSHRSRPTRHSFASSLWSSALPAPKGSAELFVAAPSLAPSKRNRIRVEGICRPRLGGRRLGLAAPPTPSPRHPAVLMRVQPPWVRAPNSWPCWQSCVGSADTHALSWQLRALGCAARDDRRQPCPGVT